MDVESFQSLALRVISREATDDERRALEAELASAPARQAEFEELKVTHDVLRTTAPLAEAAAAKTTSPELPAHRVGELRTAVRQHFGSETKAKTVGSPLWGHILRWVFGGGGLAAAVFAVAILCFANQTIEVGSYTDDQVRSGGRPLSHADVPTAKLLEFDQDATFEAWQNAPLAWTERAKIWVDNEHDLLYVMHRVRHGQVVMQAQPLASTPEGQREQIVQVVNSLVR